jgi:hypothetical protein
MTVKTKIGLLGDNKRPHHSVDITYVIWDILLNIQSLFQRSFHLPKVLVRFFAEGINCDQSI